MKKLVIVLAVVILSSFNSFEQKTNSERESELKETITNLINEYGFNHNSKTKRLSVSFSGNNLRVVELRKDGTESSNIYLYDFKRVYRFGDIDIRMFDDISYLNIWVVGIDVPMKRKKWKKYKFVIRMDGHKNAKRLNEALKEYNELLNVTD